MKLRNVIAGIVLLTVLGLTAEYRIKAQNVHPAVDAEDSCLLGGVAAGKWIEDAAMAPKLKGGERYRIYTLKGPAGEAVGAKPESAGAPCDETQTIKFTPEVKQGTAVAGDWNAMPRIATSLDGSDATYRQIATGILRSHGILRPNVNIRQILRVDLDGDGVEEVLLTATYLAGGLGSADSGMAFRSKKGDYSFVILRKIVRGRVRNIALIEEYAARTLPDHVPNKFEVAGILDLNGDGKMEVVVHVDYYEGSSSTVFRIDGSKVTNVFGCGCGA